jgi:hypothetical protein
MDKQLNQQSISPAGRCLSVRGPGGLLESNMSCTQLLLSLQFLAAGRRRLGGSAFDSIITISHGRHALSW